MVKKLAIVAVIVVVVGGGSYLVWYALNRTPGPDRPVAPPGGPAAPAVPPSVTDQAAREAVRLYTEGQDALTAGQTDRARTLFEDVAGRFPDTWAGKRSCLELGDIYQKMGEDRKALDAFRKGQEAAGPEHAEAVQSAISTLEKKLVRGDETAQGDSDYIVRPGDTLTGIAQRMATKIELIRLANNKLDDAIRAGQTLHISRIYPEIVIDKQTYQLTLNWKGRTVRSFRVGIGKNNSTPAGEFVVETRLINPDWYRERDGQKIPYGSPDNILGTRWLGLKGTSEHTGYGIHGTTQPETIGGPTSAGCVRMQNKDVEELFQWVPIGTKVTIK